MGHSNEDDEDYKKRRQTNNLDSLEEMNLKKIK